MKIFTVKCVAYLKCIDYFFMYNDLRLKTLIAVSLATKLTTCSSRHLESYKNVTWSKPNYELEHSATCGRLQQNIRMVVFCHQPHAPVAALPEVEY